VRSLFAYACGVRPWSCECRDDTEVAEACAAFEANSDIHNLSAEFGTRRVGELCSSAMNAHLRHDRH
jgi:hypothetical protein